MRPDSKFLTDHGADELVLADSIPDNEMVVFGTDGKPYKINSADLKKAIPNAVMLYQENDGDIPLRGNVQFLNTTDSEEGMLVVVGDDGYLGLRRSTDTFVDWTDTDTYAVPLGTTKNERLSVTIDEDIQASVGNWVITCKVDNSTNQERELSVSLLADGTEIGSRSVTIIKQASLQSVTFSGGFDNDAPSGTVFTVEFLADSNGALMLRGDTVPTAIKIQKTIPASRIYRSSASLPQQLTRSAIEAVVSVAGRKGRFVITDGSKVFSVVALDGEYYYKKLRKAN